MLDVSEISNSFKHLISPFPPIPRIILIIYISLYVCIQYWSSSNFLSRNVFFHLLCLYLLCTFFIFLELKFSFLIKNKKLR